MKEKGEVRRGEREKGEELGTKGSSVRPAMESTLRKDKHCELRSFEEDVNAHGFMFRRACL